jgi:hypothetical protein
MTGSDQDQTKISEPSEQDFPSTDPEAFQVGMYRALLESLVTDDAYDSDETVTRN